MSCGYICLERDGSDVFTLGREDVRDLVGLARMYGWHDPEARRALNPDSDGTPDALTGRSARALAAALEEALDDLPDHDAVSHKLRTCPRTGWVEEDPRRPVSLIERFSGPSKETLRDLVAFCRRGPFAAVFDRY
jgi:hypothetical protein